MNKQVEVAITGLAETIENDIASIDMDTAIMLWEIIPDDYTPRLVRVLSPLDGEIHYMYKAGILSNYGLTEGFEYTAYSPAEAIARVFLAWYKAVVAAYGEWEAAQ